MLRNKWMTLFLAVAFASLSAAVVSASVSTNSAPPKLSMSGQDIGIGRFSANVWGMATAVVANPTDQVLDQRVIVYMDDTPQQQFARDIWMPARSVQKTWVPIRPTKLTADDKLAKMSAMLTSATEKDQDSPLMRQSFGGVVERTRLHTGVVFSLDDEPAVRMMIAARKSLGDDDRMNYLSPGILPVLPQAYAGLDHLVLGRSDMMLNAAQTEVLRQWVIQGGRLWILADQVPPALLTQILGNEGLLEIVDRVELNKLKFSSVEGNFERELERPVTLVRVLASSSWTPAIKLGQWPAALQKKFGRGLITITTVSPRAWITIKGDATPPLDIVAGWFGQKTDSAALHTLKWDQFLAGQVGYKVMSRQIVIGILGLISAALLVVGWYLHRRGRLEHIGWVATILVSLGSTVLLLIGRAQRKDTPSTIVNATAVEVIPQTNWIQSSGDMLIYPRQQERQGRIENEQPGILIPDLSLQQGALVRMSWSDLNRWSWRGLSFPENAMLRAEYEQSGRMDSQTTATLSFNDRGAVVRLAGKQIENLSDQILVGPTGRQALVPVAGQTGQYVSSLTDVLAPGQYISGTLSGDDQIRHQGIYKQLFESGTTLIGSTLSYRPSYPVLLGWSSSLSTGLSVNVDAKRVESSLLAIPLEIVRPAEGTKVVLPSSFVPFRVLRNDSASGTSSAGQSGTTSVRNRLATAYDVNTGQWIKVTLPGVLDLRFDVPAQLHPIKLSSGKASIHINAPGRTVELFAVTKQGEQQSLLKQDSPLGLLAVDVPGEILESSDQDHGVRLALQISDTVAGQTTQPWEIKSLTMQLAGEIPNR